MKGTYLYLTTSMNQLRVCHQYRKEQKMNYRVHRFPIKMTEDQVKLEQFLNNLKGRVISIVPNVTLNVLWAPKVDFLLIVEELPD